MSMDLLPELAERRQTIVKLLSELQDLINASGLLTTEVMSYYTTFKVVLENPVWDETPLPPQKIEVLIALTRMEESIAHIARIWMREKPPTELLSEGGSYLQTK